MNSIVYDFTGAIVIIHVSNSILYVGVYMYAPVGVQVAGKAHLNRLREKNIHRITEGLANTHKRELRREAKHADKLTNQSSTYVNGLGQVGGMLGATQLSGDDDADGGEGLTVTTLSTTGTSEEPSSMTNGQQSSYGQSGELVYTCIHVVTNLILSH